MREDNRDKKNILIFCSLEKNRGAGRAVYELKQAFINSGYESIKLFTPETAHELLNRFEYILWVFFFKSTHLVERFLNFFLLPTSIFEYYSHTTLGVPFFVYARIVKKTDVVFFTWIEAGLLSWKAKKKISYKVHKTLWRFSDMNPLTGGCHYALDCNLFHSQCYSCPQQNKNKKYLDISKINFMIKKRNILSTNVDIISPSKWMLNQISSSFLMKNLKSHHIRTFVDQNVFSPATRQEIQKSRDNFGVKGICIVVGAVNSLDSERKGKTELQQLENILENINIESTLLVFGSKEKQVLHVNKFHRILTGTIVERDSLRNLLICGDLFFAPYIQDNQPNTVLEAFSVGLPVLARNGSGMTELITDSNAGWLYDGINEPLLNSVFGDLKERSILLRNNAIEYISASHNTKKIISKYIELLE